MGRRTAVVRKRWTPEYRRRVFLEFLQDHLDGLLQGPLSLINRGITETDLLQPLDLR
jgi:hypothetical protein